MLSLISTKKTAQKKDKKGKRKEKFVHKWSYLGGICGEEGWSGEDRGELPLEICLGSFILFIGFPSLGLRPSLLDRCTGPNDPNSSDSVGGP